MAIVCVTIKKRKGEMGQPCRIVYLSLHSLYPRVSDKLHIQVFISIKTFFVATELFEAFEGLFQSNVGEYSTS